MRCLYLELATASLPDEVSEPLLLCEGLFCTATSENLAAHRSGVFGQLYYAATKILASLCSVPSKIQENTYLGVHDELIIRHPTIF